MHGRDRGPNLRCGDQRGLEQWQQGTPADWALVPLAIVRAQVYGLSASGEIEASYIERARPVIRTRLMQAGARLGWLLNQSLPE